MTSISNEQDERRDLQCLDSSPPVFHRMLGGSSLVQQKSSTQLFVAEELLNTVENDSNNDRNSTPEEIMINVDDHPSSSTDESDIDAFLEYARDMIEADNMSYDSVSFEDFEDLLEECIANHFLDDSNIDDDSMTSESSFSGYANDEGCDSSVRYKTAIIARKKTKDTDEILRVTNYYNNETETIDSSDDSSYTSINSAQFKVHDYVSNINSLTELSDSSSSIVNEYISRQPKRRNIRNKKAPSNNIKRTVIRESSSLDLDSDATPNEFVGTKISTFFNGPRSKENVLNYLNKNAPTLHNSIVTRLRLERDREHGRECKINIQKAMTISENFGGNESVNFHTPEKQQYRGFRSISPAMNIDTSNVIQPSMIKKEAITNNTKKDDDGAGMIFMKITDHVLNGMLERQVMMNRKRQVLHQLNERIDSKMQEENFSQRGMALIHKIRARRKAALQAVFLRNSKEEKGVLKPKPEVSIPTTVEKEFSETLNLSFQEPEDLMTVISLSPISTVEEKKQWLEEVIPIFKASPFKKITFSRSKIEKNYEALSSESSLTNATSSSKPTSDTSSLLKTSPSSPKNSRYTIPEFVSRVCVTPESSGSVSLFSDYNPCDSSDNINDRSCWSEMSFLSDTNRFTDSSVSSPRLLVQNGSGQNIHGSQTQQYHDGVVPSPQRKDTRTSYNDSFDEIVLRNTPGKNLSTGLGILSPTGVMDLISVVDTDEEDHVFTDKEDSYVMKLPESSPYYLPIFFTSRRFEV
ncbi:hypothetical protein FRACYDRAFT_236987 [Fragilariopsis cylindrus CCMP1102]|uniref:Uncharacterized protein n=1 Tax=Fragilariopsis cylindrus CCMP1102 TaxID=635003 RepID=A0A1E7FKK5_9STRA|nr:hypothetical protein FRACYDRAFT_236987 [Fragilariopsis cylindrus CCMP1102]|eukprot:OEU18709.1 hypothetical protein FRACYDRAFT_236987 [Fragilariopsis cylindrus CCMP1102]